LVLKGPALLGAVLFLFSSATNVASTRLASPYGPRQLSEPGIKYLTEEARIEAIACGKAGAECAVIPYLLCPTDPRYSVRLATPYSRVAFSVYEAERTHRRSRPPTRGGANGWGVGVFVSPASNSEMADSIEKAFIMREDKTIPPTTTTLAPVIVERRPGDKVQLSKAFFAFSPEVFRPGSSLSIVLVGPSGETTCVVDQHHLASLR
jgi:hypothetical protein